MKLEWCVGLPTAYHRNKYDVRGPSRNKIKELQMRTEDGIRFLNSAEVFIDIGITMLINHILPGSNIYCECDNKKGDPSGRKLTNYPFAFYCFNCNCVYCFRQMEKERLKCDTTTMEMGKYLRCVLYVYLNLFFTIINI
eukprot:GHVR01004571.1.p1 GENE.GHVR01004571.1~~GHVR01004571.1.p1  ORF type:complete len:139 (-),score=4.10 GHVR01004571.1:82-498(-)